MDDLRCNSLKCRKSLSLEGSAVVTTCSHIFCVQCANSLFSQPQICPACETSLPEPDDAVQTNLSPPDAYKTSVLAGLTPILVLDIASRALNFYTYQVQQESAFQSLVTKNAQERIAVLESQCQNIIREATSEITLLKDRVTVSERDLELERRKVRDLQETHKANAKAYSKLKAQLDKAQQRALLAPSANSLTNNFVSAAANQHLPPVAQFNSHPSSSSTPILRPSSTIQPNNNNHGSNMNNSHNRALQGWSNTFGGGLNGNGLTGPSSQPISNQPGHSINRPRRSLQDQNLPPSNNNIPSHHSIPRSGITPIMNNSNSFVSGGQGYFGSNAGVMPMPSNNNLNSRRRSREVSVVAGNGSGGVGGGNTSDSSGGSGGKSNGMKLKYLGQQNRQQSGNTGFRPASAAFQ